MGKQRGYAPYIYEIGGLENSKAKLMQYTYQEIFWIFKRCNSFKELEKINDGFLKIIADGDLPINLIIVTGKLSKIKLRQLRR
jgi:hypothetical protein